jgi:hypothetical protein
MFHTHKYRQKFRRKDTINVQICGYMPIMDASASSNATIYLAQANCQLSIKY